MKKLMGLTALLGAAIGQEFMTFKQSEVTKVEEPEIEEITDESEYADITHENLGSN